MISLSGIYLKLAHFPMKIGLIQGLGGVPEISYFLLMLLGSPCNNLEHHGKPLWDIFEISPFSSQNRVKWGGGVGGSP